MFLKINLITLKKEKKNYYTVLFMQRLFAQCFLLKLFYIFFITVHFY